MKMGIFYRLYQFFGKISEWTLVAEVYFYDKFMEKLEKR